MSLMHGFSFLKATCKMLRLPSGFRPKEEIASELIRSSFFPCFLVGVRGGRSGHVVGHVRDAREKQPDDRQAA